jgi:threonine synthase
LAGHRAWFACYGGCDERYPLDEVRYRCARCGGLLDVRHDTAALAARSGAEWKQLFDQRAGVRLCGAPATSGVWSKREWVCPDVGDDDIVSLGEGWTPLLPMPALGEAMGLPGLLVKQCGQSPTGSFKDLGMTVLVSMVRRMRARGRPIRAVACASTGDTSAALAAYCARAGIPSIVFLPAGKITDEQLIQPIASFALTVSLDTDFDGCMKLVAAFCEKHGVYLANSMNPLRMEGQKTIAVEICQQLGWQAPDFIVVPGGNLGNVTAIGKGLRLLRDLGLFGQQRPPRLVVAQAAAAAPLHAAFHNGWQFQAVTAAATQASAIRIGDPVNVRKAIDVLREFDGLVGAASEDELSEAAVLGDRHGLYADPHTGVALAVARRLRDEGHIPKAARVVVISTAHGLKFGGFKRDYHLGEKGAPSDRGGAHRNAPLSLPATLSAAEAAILPRLE